VSTGHSPQVFSAPSKQTHGFKPKGDRNLIASIRALSMISIAAVGLKGRMTKTPNENKIPVCYNGLNRSKWFHSSGPPPSTLIMHLRARKQLGLNIVETRTYFLTYYPRTIFFTHRASGLCRYATTQSRIVHNLAHK
jgi:hypothetical protein